MRNQTHVPLSYLALCLGLAVGCGGGDDEVDSVEEARRAYLGMDESIAKSIKLGFDGFNSATNANIAPQVTTGTTGGMLTITGQVDQGVSANKEMRLRVGMVGYSDGPVVIDESGDTIELTYDTTADTTMQPYLELKLSNIPTGTLGGSLMGTYQLRGDIVGELTLSITFTGRLMAGPNNTVLRAPGTTTVTGTAVSGEGTYMINLSI